jgi:hypothetical protein
VVTLVAAPPSVPQVIGAPEHEPARTSNTNSMLGFAENVILGWKVVLFVGLGANETEYQSPPVGSGMVPEKFTDCPMATFVAAAAVGHVWPAVAVSQHSHPSE